MLRMKYRYISIQNVRDVRRFIDFVGSPPHAFFNYKWIVPESPDRFCSECGRRFTATRQRQKYCFKKCNDSAQHGHYIRDGRSKKYASD